MEIMKQRCKTKDMQLFTITQGKYIVLDITNDDVNIWSDVQDA